MPVIVCARVDRHRAAGARREVFEQLDTGAARGAQRGDSQTRAEHIVEALLLDAKVLARARDFQSERISIETEARVGVGDDDRGVIDAEEQPIGLAMPLRIALTFGEVEDLEVIAIGIAKVEGGDAARVRIPGGNSCGPVEACSTWRARKC